MRVLTNQAPTEPKSTDWGCLVVGVVTVLSPVYGFVVQEVVVGILAGSWTSCFGMAWQVTYDLADSPRIGLFGFVGYSALYAACLPVGLLAAARVLRHRRRLTRAAVGVALGIVLTLIGFTDDLMLHISAPYPASWDGPPPISRCVAGRPAWWPTWLPARPSDHPLPQDR